MAGYQDGRMEAFEQVYARLSGVLLRYLASLTRDRSRAEDLLQETFLQIHRSRRSYSPSRPVQPWAFAIARHVYLMDLRTASRRVRPVACEFDETPDPIAPDLDITRRMQRDEVRDALQQVPADRRQALVLHHVAGLSFREIGRKLGIREAAAKLRSSRGIGNLRSILGRRTEDEKDPSDGD